MKSHSIRYYFFTSITTVLVATVLLMGLIQTLLAMSYFQREKEAMLEELLSAVREEVKDGQPDQWERATGSLVYLVRISEAALFITEDDGTVVYSAGKNAPQVQSLLPPEVMQRAAANGWAYTDIGKMGGLFAVDHYNRGAKIVGPQGQSMGYVFASASTEDLQVYLWDMGSSFVFSAAVVLIVSIVLAYFLFNRTVIPIRRINQAARRFGEGDYSARVPVEGDDELGQLAHTFNEMANSFEATDISRRSFMGNIAHELRTPMTSVKGFIDGMLDGTIPEENRDKYLVIVGDEVGRLARLTKNMLDISRLEAGEYSPNIRNFDIRETMAAVLRGAEARLAEKSLLVENRGPGSAVRVQADEDFTHQVIFNLIDNAIKFANDGGKITLSIARAKGVVTVGIRNTGSAIHTSALPHVFDRFYKVDKSRGLNARGAGLGLHISKVLLGVMGGKIWAESEKDEWTEFLFTLPAVPAKTAAHKKGLQNAKTAPKRKNTAGGLNEQ